jgi:hypothetical protein
MAKPSIREMHKKIHSLDAKGVIELENGQIFLITEDEGKVSLFNIFEKFDSEEISLKILTSEEE